MNNIIRIYFYLCCLLLICSCQEITKSFKETKNPVPTSNINDANELVNNTSITTTTVKEITKNLQTMNSDNAIDDSALMNLIEAQLKNTGIKDTTVLSRIRLQLRKMPQLKGKIETRWSNLIKDGTQLDLIQTQLQNLPQFKGKKLMVYNGIYIYKNGAEWIINVRIQNPDNLENVDNYRFENGEWQTPTPDRSPTLDGKVSYLFPLDSIHFSAAKEVYDVTTQKSKDIEGAEPVRNIHFSYSSFRSKSNAEWYTNLRGARNDYRFRFDIKGNFVEMKKQ